MWFLIQFFWLITKLVKLIFRWKSLLFLVLHNTIKICRILYRSIFNTEKMWVSPSWLCGYNPERLLIKKGRAEASKCERGCTPTVIRQPHTDILPSFHAALIHKKIRRLINCPHTAQTGSSSYGVVIENPIWVRFNQRSAWPLIQNWLSWCSHAQKILTPLPKGETVRYFWTTLH